MDDRWPQEFLVGNVVCKVLGGLLLALFSVVM